MIEDKAELLQEIIVQNAGALVEVNPESSGTRKGLRVHFSGWTRQGGPVFSLIPSGLNRHLVKVRFGNYARPCVTHIENTVTEEQYAVARALVSHLAEQYEVRILPAARFEDWIVSTDLEIIVTIKGIENQQDETLISKSTQAAMVPLIAAVAELIGCNDGEYTAKGDLEGNVLLTTTTRRERSRRNRLLCLSLHGSICSICGMDPVIIYGKECGDIIEVHHIEPLSEIESPQRYDPRSDLIPLCPDCHRAIHRRIPAYTPDELKAIMLSVNAQ